ncbi:hypothetical protein ABFU65_11035 [Xanthomonas campestris pv. raphani]|uniref:hypothetical protein n=1 Tax=Xanthomonas campestris TaxID=339 RepID=UPI002B23AD3B|nr:hypothetical protein [Xanthomonas campestris]MEA9654878.1 hypothetical protein [Xanthomonas campestris pv. raphani]
MKPWQKALLVSIWASVLALALWRGGAVTFAQQWPLYEALRNTAAIIFAVVGAWLAIVYPERLKMSQGKAAQSNPDNADKVVKLLEPIVNSTIILAVILLVGLIAPLIRQFPFVRENVSIFRSISFIILASLTLLQVCTVVLTLIPASDVRHQVLQERAVKKTIGVIFSRGKRRGSK